MKHAYIIALGIVIAGALVAGAVVYTNGGPDGSSEEQVAENEQAGQDDGPSRVDMDDIDIEGWPTLGSQNASIVMVEYSDYACPYCKRNNDQTRPTIIENYVDTGEILMVFKDFAVVGGDRAAEAAHCAAEQDAYWEYHDHLFSQQGSDRGQWANSEVHRGYAEALGLDADALVECFEDRRYQSKVTEATREAQEMGGRGTPYFIINGQPVSGAQPYPVFEQVIDRELTNEN